MAVRIEAYQPTHLLQWDELVRRSKNATFLFRRQFMEYHADRFVDASVLAYDGHKLLAAMPASLHQTDSGPQVRSHGGLTYGGLFCDERMTASTMLEVMTAVLEHYRVSGVKSVVYKPIPHIYHRLPAEEDLYALFRVGGQLVRRDVAASLDQGARPPITKGRKWATKQGINNGITVGASQDWGGFMAMEAALLLEKYGTRPVHSADEMALLHERFPQQVKLYTALHEGQLVGGTVIFDCDSCVHAQYISSTRHGRDLRALDVLFQWLIDEVYADRRWFDFGISTEEAGRVLNAGLADNKESWGARSVVYDHYHIPL